MVEVVAYEYRVEYGHDPRGHLYPRLSLQLASATEPDLTVDIDAHLDSGAEKSLVSGRLGISLGIDVLSGPQLVYQTTMGARLVATLHPVQLMHPELGLFRLEVGFSTSDIQRNLLGRDFFDLVQIGFRERHRMIFLSPTP